MEIRREIRIKSSVTAGTLRVRITESDAGLSLIGTAACYLHHIYLAVKRKLLIVSCRLIVTFRRHEPDITQKSFCFGYFDPGDDLSVCEIFLAKRTDPAGCIMHLSGTVLNSLWSYHQTSVFDFKAFITAVFFKSVIKPSGRTLISDPDFLVD